ncbi:MAG TPA: site-specific recombinase [Methylophilaceae bacterium]
MEHIFRHYTYPQTSPQSPQQGDSAQPIDPVALVTELVDQIRPANSTQVADAVYAIQALCYLLDHHPDYAAMLRDSLLRLLGEHKPVSLYVDAGIQPSSGFFTEMRRRVGHKFLPDAVDATYLKDIFAQIFCKASDEDWVLAVPDSVWIELIQAIRFRQADPQLNQQCVLCLIDAVQVLSYRLAASGLEPELIRNHQELEEYTSPFMMQNVEMHAFLKEPASFQVTNSPQIFVMLDQCRSIIAKVRRNSAQVGTSISLTFLLQGMTQQIERLETLLRLLMCFRSNNQMGLVAEQHVVTLLKTLVSAECHKNDVAQHWRQNMEILALRVTENASRTGEHYITETRGEYFALMKSAMGAGLVVGLMAMIKILIAKMYFPPLTEAILFSLNYGLGFVFIHMLHFTVATKQPAMTAAAIAASIDASDGKTKNMDKLVTIIAQTMRSQTIAIIGNVLIAVPMAMLIAWLVYLVMGEHFVSPYKAEHLLADINPVHSGALFYAAIAGLCLFLSGLIAGYHDNMAVYNKIPQRIKALKWLQKLLGIPRLHRMANYIENNLGALAGNFYFGCLLGGMAALGVLLGLPIDIRHITFSSAFVGFSLVGLDFQFTPEMAVMAVLGVLLIGTVNLLVSFTLALYVAMKSRQLSFAQWRALFKAVFSKLRHEPRVFFLPPKDTPSQSALEHD